VEQLIQAKVRSGPFFKDKEIEDIFDLKFYHPLGYRIAIFFNRLNFSPNTVSFISMIIGLIGGALIYYDHLITASALIVLTSVLDSSDGQLARMSGKRSVYGRIIDGLVGYVVFTSIYLAIGFAYYHRYGYIIFVLMILAGVSNAVQNSVYDFYRTAFLSVSKNDYSDFFDHNRSGFFSMIYDIYNSYQRALCKWHLKFLSLVVELKKSKLNTDEIKAYREKMLKNIQFVNLLGDNWKINGIIILSLVGRIDLFFWYVIIVLNIFLIIALLRQRKIDREIIGWWMSKAV
jgi:hypothetical protein